MKRIIEYAKKLYALGRYECHPVSEHEGGRNYVYICSCKGENKYALRISALGDREAEDYLAEIEFVHYLAQNGAPVTDVIPSVNGKMVECIEWMGKTIYISLFTYAKGMLISDNGYRYREGVSLDEYFYNTGKTLGEIHKLSKKFSPSYRRPEYFERYDMKYIDQLIPDTYVTLKEAIARKLEVFQNLPIDKCNYGLVHFDFSDGNYHIDMNTGEITVFDFDNCMYCWYMFDLANLWTHGVGWCQFEENAQKRKAFMNHYFDMILQGYRSETDVSAELLEQLALFIDMVLIENVIDEFECCERAGEELDYEDIVDAAECLIKSIPYTQFFAGTIDECRYN